MAAEAALGAFLQVTFETIIDLLLKELRLEHEFKNDLENLKNTVSMIQAVLSDAEEKQQTENAVKLWLQELRDVAYDAMDTLDEFATEAQRRRLVSLPRLRDSLSIVNPMRGIFRHGISRKLKEIRDRLDDIGKRRQNLGLRADGPRHEGESSQILQTTSINARGVMGRENDKQAIVRWLMSSDGVVDTGISLLPILGMCGLGKTSLAQLVYNDDTVENHFELRLWVHVSQNFNVVKLTKAILESIDGFACDTINLDVLQRHLQRKLDGRRYLLVLDDVWNENPQEWDSLRGPLLSGAEGSKILVTTTSKEVADMMGTTDPYLLLGLSDDDCLSLFCQRAMAQNTHAYPSLDHKIGEEIVKKCKGLPLAAIALGHRFCKVTDRRKWETILRNESWEFSGENSDISRAVGPTYQQLPAHLKACFAYCSIIPKGFEFEEEFIVQLWMAQNFIQPRGGERIEDTGSSYFDSLVRRSFFELSRFDCKSGQPIYTIPDLIHDYGQHVSAGECCTMKVGQPNNFSATIRHLSLIYDQFVQNDSRSQTSIFETLNEFKRLHTLLLVHGSVSNCLIIPDNLAERFGRLRTLDLSNSGLNVLPKSVGDLKHLRCLQLRNTKISRLPKSVSSLYNLQTLGLRNCYCLEELPEDMKNLRKLRHLDLHLDDDSTMMKAEDRHRLRSMPPEIGLLTDIQTLSRFVIGARPRCGVSELKDLNDIHGELFISNLQLVPNAEEAVKADLARKQYIQKLELQWSHGDSSKCRAVEQQVLDSLQPHTNIKELTIAGYSDTSFPTWIGRSIFSNLVTLRLFDCKNFATLPSLGQLPMLRDLYIKGMDRVQAVNCEFCGHGNRTFPSLKKLHFESMQSLQVWCGNNWCELPCLHELVIKNCNDLRQLTHNLPSLKILKIEGSPWLMGLPRFPSLRALEVMRASGDWIWKSWRCLASLSSLTLNRLPTKTFPSGLLSTHASLRRLEISHFDQLLSLPDDGLPRGLVYFGIKHCPQLNSLPSGLQDLQALEVLEIHDCEQLRYLPEGLRNLNSLHRLVISDCPCLLSLPTDGLPTSVRLVISNCPHLR